MIKTFKLSKKSKPAKPGDPIAVYKNKKAHVASPICSQCNSRQVYTLKNLTVVCRKCGHREKPKEEDT